MHDLVHGDKSIWELDHTFAIRSCNSIHEPTNSHAHTFMPLRTHTNHISFVRTQIPSRTMFMISYSSWPIGILPFLSIFKPVLMHTNSHAYPCGPVTHMHLCARHSMYECRRAYLFSCTPIQPHTIAPTDLSATHLSSEARERLTCSAFAVSSMYRCASPD